MKKRFCLIMAIVILLPVILIIEELSLPSYYSETYYAELPDMFERLSTTEGKKIVIVGGSNVAFGVNSAQLQSSLGQYGFNYSVCNFGLYAAVGTSAMLSLSENFLREGDIVVLAVEPTSETYSTYFGATAMLKCAEDTPSMLLYLNAEQRSQIVGNYIGYLQERAGIRRSGILPQPTGAYAKAAFDDQCDMIFVREGNIMPLGYDTSAPLDLAGLIIQNDFAAQVNAYIAAANKKGAQVVISFSPMNRAAVTDQSEDAVYSYYMNIVNTFDCPVISNPNRYIMDSGWFYDNNFHLNSAGAVIRTNQLCRDLLTYLGCSSQVKLEAPDMPAAAAVIDDEESDSNDFIFESVGENGLMICGLTAQGAAKQELTVPSAVSGKAVVGLTADVFAGNKVITSLTLPDTIESIPDAAFSGCESLTALTLLHRDRLANVGSGLFDGAPSLTVYVPADAWHLYRDGAGCASNTWESYINRIKEIPLK